MVERVDRGASTAALQLFVAAYGFGTSPRPCDYSMCTAIASLDDGLGNLSQVGSVNLGNRKNPLTGTIQSTVSVPAVAAAKDVTVTIDTKDASGNYTVVQYTTSVPLAVLLPDEQLGGGNPSENECQCQAGDPVNEATGEFFENYTDLALPGVGPAVAVSRGYSSQSTASGPFGYGWSSNLGMHIQVVTLGSTQPQVVDVVQENGSTVEFSLDSTGAYIAPGRVRAALALDAGTGEWTFTRRKAEVFVFDPSGVLLSASDAHGNAVAYSHNGSGQITSIDASGGRNIQVSWSGGCVSALTDSAGRSAAYSYDTSGNLVSATSADGQVTHYAYSTPSNHLLTSVTDPRGSVTTTAYNTAARRVTSQTDPLGRQTTFTWNSTNVTVQRPDGSKTQDSFVGGLLAMKRDGADTASPTQIGYIYDADGNVVFTTDALGNPYAYTYDANGDVLTQTDPFGHTITLAYNSLGEVTSVTDALGRVTSASYDSAGDKLSATSPSAAVQRWTYNADGTVASWQSATGGTTTYAYDSAGRLNATTDPDGRVSHVGYNAAGFVTSVSDPGGNSTSYTVDALGRVLTSTDPLGHTTSNVYDADGDLTHSTDPLGNVTARAYDAAGELASTTDPLGHTTSYTYRAGGQLATTTDPLGHVTATDTYDSWGRLLTSKDGDASTTTYGYDKDGHLTSVRQPSGESETYAYDAAGREISSTDFRGKTTSYAYDAGGEQTSSTDPLGRVTSTSYTPDGHVSMVTLPGGSTESWTYDAAGRTLSYTDPDGKATSYSYDAAGLLGSEVEPGSLTTSYTYDAVGRTATATQPSGVVETLSYDAASRLTGIDYSGSMSADATYGYDADGNRTGMTDATGTSSYVYDAAGRLTSATDGDGQTLGYSYDSAGKLTGVVYPGSRTVSYTYDNAGQMTGVTDWASNHTGFSWNSDSLPTSVAYADGVTQARTYDADGDPVQYTATSAAGTLLQTTVSYDNSGQATGVGVARAGGALATTSYAYDSLGQLTTAGSAGSYAATAAGLLTAMPGGTTLSYNSAEEVSTLTPASGSATSFSYDGDGARSTATTSTATTNYSYTAAGSLAEVQTPTDTVSYASDGDGLRQSRTQGGTTAQLLWDTAGALPLLLDDGVESFVYGPGSTPIEQVDDTTGVVQYLVSDALGSPRLIADAAGADVGEYDYSEYGTPTHSGTAGTAVGFTGAWTDSVTGLVYLRARDLDPATGQFLQRDPLVDQTRQAYAYAANDPLRKTDPTGLCIGMDGTPQDRVCTQWDFYVVAALPRAGLDTGAAVTGFLNGASLGLYEKLNPQQFCWVQRNYGTDLNWGSAWGQATNLVAYALLGRGEGEEYALPAGDGPLPGLPESAPQLTSLSPTGRFAPANLKEQLAMEEVRSAPGGQRLNNLVMNDIRWPASKGWVKMQQNVNGVVIHYVKNVVTGEVDDFKFVSAP